jgi:hypothetical protein
LLHALHPPDACGNFWAQLPGIGSFARKPLMDGAGSQSK